MICYGGGSGDGGNGKWRYVISIIITYINKLYALSSDP